MQTINCLIVEDEPLAAEILEDYIRQVPFLELSATCADAIFALEKLNKEKIDLIFLDINLPKLRGIEFIKSLQQPPHIVITSAHQEYALKGYELNVVDYLLKPVEFSRFLMAANKVRQQKEIVSASGGTPLLSSRPYLFFNVGKKRVKLFTDEILYIESVKEYVKIFTLHKSVFTKFGLGQLEELLATNNFLRVHRSFLVAKDKIDAFSATDIEINGKQIPIGRSYKDQVYAVLK